MSAGCAHRAGDFPGHRRSALMVPALPRRHGMRCAKDHTAKGDYRHYLPAAMCRLTQAMTNNGRYGRPLGGGFVCVPFGGPAMRWSRAPRGEPTLGPRAGWVRLLAWSGYRSGVMWRTATEFDARSIST